mmetsp:Transcript_16982/g.43084  ORF Transcript_16982/g.43084 Transcript_16982/m.43084 type:complete len:205 (-) Transcript_16982:301-915(-)
MFWPARRQKMQQVPSCDEDGPSQACACMQHGWQHAQPRVPAQMAGQSCEVLGALGGRCLRRSRSVASRSRSNRHRRPVRRLGDPRRARVQVSAEREARRARGLALELAGRPKLVAEMRQATRWAAAWALYRVVVRRARRMPVHFDALVPHLLEGALQQAAQRRVKGCELRHRRDNGEAELSECAHLARVEAELEAREAGAQHAQ